MPNASFVSPRLGLVMSSNKKIKNVISTRMC